MIAVLLPSGPPAHQASATAARRRLACRTPMSRRTPRCGLEREGRSSGERPGNAGTGARRISQFPETSHREPALPWPACRLHGLVDGVLGDDVDGLALRGVRARQPRVALMILRVQ